MPETTTTTDLPTITLDPSLCCCGTTTTPEPYPCKCMLPFTLDFRTNVVAPITLEINMPRGNSGFPAQNLFFKSYIYGCHGIGSPTCRENNTFRISFCSSNPTVGAYDYPGSSIEEPANCNIGIRTPRDVIPFDEDLYLYTGRGGCTLFDYYFYRDYLSYVEGIYGYLPPLIELGHWYALNCPVSSWCHHDFSFNGSNGLFTCCKPGILQHLLMHKVDAPREISDVKVNLAVFTPKFLLKFPIFTVMIAEAWKRGELDSLTLYGPITLHVLIEWAFSVSVELSGVPGSLFASNPVSLNFNYYFSTQNSFVKVLQFPFSGDSVNLDHHDQCNSDIGVDYRWWFDYNARPAGIDSKTMLSIAFPDILNAIENMRATLHFGEIIPNPSHSGDGTIDWEYVYKGWKYYDYIPPIYYRRNPFRYCSWSEYDTPANPGEWKRIYEYPYE